MKIAGHKLIAQTKQTIVGKAPITIAGDKLVFTSRSGKDILVHENSSDVQFKLVTELKVRNKNSILLDTYVFDYFRTHMI